MVQRVKGEKELVEAIKKMAKMYTEKDIKTILNSEAKKLVSTMRGLAPEKTGRLRQHIKVLPKNSNYKYTVLAGIDYKPDGKGTLTIPALASITEYGASAGFPHKNKGYWRHQINGEWVTLYERAPIAPRPFIRPAFDMSKSNIQKNIIKKLATLAKRKGKELGFG